MDLAIVHLASVAARSDGLFIHALHQTDAGFWTAGLPAVRLSPEAPLTALGAAVQQALAASRRGVPTPKRNDISERDHPVLQEFGMRSWKALQGDARLCQVEQRGETVEITPMRNGGTKGQDKGFHELSADAFSVPVRDLTAEALGGAVKRGLDRALAPPAI